MRLGGYVVIGHDIPANFEYMEMKDAIKKIFEEGKKMNFGQALELAKNGKRITRMGWNGIGQYVMLGEEFTYKTNIDLGHGEHIVEMHKDIGGKALVFVESRRSRAGWLASQEDMLAEDWIEYHEPKDKEKSEESPQEKDPCACRCEKERDPWRKLITRKEYRAGVQKLKEEHLDKKIEERGHEGMGALLFAMSGLSAVGLLENILFGEEGE